MQNVRGIHFAFFNFHFSFFIPHPNRRRWRRGQTLTAGQFAGM
jgi:hypothetical protein